MAVPHLPNSNGASRVAESSLSLDQRKQRLAAKLRSKVEQGYEVESQTDTAATIVSKGRRHWFGLKAGDPSRDTRVIVSIDEQGDTTTRLA